ncbi:MAG: glycosyltransferase [Gammaproteobacteria bacterium]|nr:glycosyltransferase [Gammaproteobacteria bacterium]
MRICIFSYNRPKHLTHCIKSIEQCAPNVPLTIYDDASTDAETQAILEEASKKHTVVNTKALDSSKIKCGGLYNNMQLAIEQNNSSDPLCFIQDDMQLVRPIDQDDLDDIDAFFTQNPDSAFLHQAFLKGVNKERDQQQTEWVEEKKAYFRNAQNRSAGTHFAAVCIVHPERLLKANWEFATKEPLNDKAAKQHFGKMGFMKNPFLMWLPNVPAFRGKKKTLGLKIAEKKRDSGFYPFKIMDAAEVNDLKQRTSDILPVAEDYLHFSQKSVPHPWFYHPLEGAKFLKFINKLELKLRNLFK